MSSQHMQFRDSIASMDQYPLHFACRETDQIAKYLTSFGNTFQERIVYMGPRHTNSYQAFKNYSKFGNKQDKNHERNEYEQAQLYCKSMFQKYSIDVQGKRQKYVPVRAEQYRLFRGMNPTASKDELTFDSNFQCGNLDLAVKVAQNTYDLFMRVDSNTKGHTCWFFFKVTQCQQSTVKFNIFNFSRQDLMYNSRYKIATFTSSKKFWVQAGKQIEFDRPERFNYVDENGHQCEFIRKDAYCLSFEYKFDSKDQYVYFAYCIPYSYTYMLNYVEELNRKYAEFLTVQYQNRSTGGLKIPVLTIDNHINCQKMPEKYKKQNKKPTCLIIGRLHPGQTQASWLLQGFINYLCSKNASYLRDNIIFKIVPMVNVDGVVLGNFRTGIIGRDLNRLFKRPELSKQVEMIRLLAAKHKPFLFLDFHGHSSKKYVFAYGPDYSIDHRYFLQSRLLAKLFQRSTPAFRYYACSFRVGQGRKSTARAVFLRQFEATYSYTIEASVHSYGPKGAEKLFNNEELIKVGEQMGPGFLNFVKIIFTMPKRSQESQQKSLKKNRESKEKLFFKRQKSQQLSTKKQMSKDMFQELSKQQRDLLQQIYLQEQSQKEKGKQQEQQDSDFEEGQDYTDLELICLLKEEPKGNGRIKLKGINKLQKKNHHNVIKITKTLTQKSVRDSSQEKSIEKKVEPKKRQPTQRHIKSRVYKQVPSVSPFLNRNVFGKSKYSSVFISSDVQSSNRIHYKHSSCVDQVNPNLNTSIEKVNLVTPVIFKHVMSPIDHGYQPFSEAKGEGSRSRNFPAQSLNLKPRKPQIKSNKKQTFEVKKPELPMLGRCGNMNPTESKSMIEQIIEKHERMKANKIRKQLKLIQF